jgi:hypothetical protein
MKTKAMPFGALLALFVVWASASARITAEDAWDKEPKTYREIPWGITFDAFLKQLHFVHICSGGGVTDQFQGDRFGPRGTSCHQWDNKKWQSAGVTCIPQETGKSTAPQYARNDTAVHRQCFDLLGGPFHGIQGAPAVTESLYFEKDTLVRVSWICDATGYSYFHNLLVEKYGPPTAHTSTGPATSLDRWVGKAVIISASERASGTESAILFEYTPDAKAKEEAKKAF